MPLLLRFSFTLRFAIEGRRHMLFQRYEWLIFHERYCYVSLMLLMTVA